jgi:hypothetical protein
MSKSSTQPRIVDYGGRRRQFDRRMNPERPTMPESRSGRQRRSGFDRRSIRNNARFKVKVERRSAFDRFREMIPEEEKVDAERMILIDNTVGAADDRAAQTVPTHRTAQDARKEISHDGPDKPD